MATAMVEAIDTAQMSLPATGGSLTGVTAMVTVAPAVAPSPSVTM